MTTNPIVTFTSFARSTRDNVNCNSISRFLGANLIIEFANRVAHFFTSKTSEDYNTIANLDWKPISACKKQIIKAVENDDKNSCLSHIIDVMSSIEVDSRTGNFSLRHSLNNHVVGIAPVTNNFLLPVQPQPIRINISDPDNDEMYIYGDRLTKLYFSIKKNEFYIKQSNRCYSIADCNKVSVKDVGNFFKEIKEEIRKSKIKDTIDALKAKRKEDKEWCKLLLAQDEIDDEDKIDAE